MCFVVASTFEGVISGGMEGGIGTRWGCRAGRFSYGARRTWLQADPCKVDGPDAAPTPPPVHMLHRVTVGFDGAPVGFSEHAFADSVTRVTWPTGRRTRATYSVRAGHERHDGKASLESPKNIAACGTTRRVVDRRVRGCRGGRGSGRVGWTRWMERFV